MGAVFKGAVEGVTMNRMKRLVSATVFSLSLFAYFVPASWGDEAPSPQSPQQVTTCALDGDYIVSGVVVMLPEYPANFYEFKGNMLFYGCPWAPLVYLDFDVTDLRIPGIFDINDGWLPYAITPAGQLDISFHGVHLRGNVGLIAPNGGTIAHSFTLLSDTPTSGFKLVAKATRVYMSPELQGRKGDKGDKGDRGVGQKGDRGDMGNPGLPGKDGLGKGTAFLCMAPNGSLKWGGADGSMCDLGPGRDKKIAIVIP